MNRRSGTSRQAEGLRRDKGEIMVYEKVVELIVEYTDVAPEDISSDSSFESLGVDSLTTVELVMALEDEFEVTLEIDGKIETVGQLVSYVESKTA
jgi:acyl carrier protein